MCRPFEPDNAPMGMFLKRIDALFIQRTRSEAPKKRKKEDRMTASQKAPCYWYRHPPNGTKKLACSKIGDLVGFSCGSASRHSVMLVTKRDGGRRPKLRIARAVYVIIEAMDDDDGRRTTDDGRRTTDDGRRMTTDDGRRQVSH